MESRARKISRPATLVCVMLWLPAVLLAPIAAVLDLANLGPAPHTPLPTPLLPLWLYVVFGPLVACVLLLCLMGQYDSTRVPRMVTLLAASTFGLEMLGIVAHVVSGG